MPLGVHVLRKLKRREGKVGIPRFDKSCHKGRGDRVDEGEWEVVDAEMVDVVLFEGWCVGFRALAGREEERMREAVEKWGDGLREVDKALEEYDQLWRYVGHLFWTLLRRGAS